MEERAIRDFAAIDFETANGSRSSVCSVGVVVVRGGEITQSVHELIRPRPNYYSWFTTRVHGMTGADTDAAPDFPEVWDRIAPLVEGLTMVAHNSPFDEGCLRAAFDLYGMEWPGYRFLCTCRTARRLLPHLPDHKLPTVASYCGFDLSNHHHALADAQACAAIAIKLL